MNANQQLWDDAIKQSGEQFEGRALEPETLEEKHRKLIRLVGARGMHYVAQLVPAVMMADKEALVSLAHRTAFNLGKLESSR